MTDADGYPIPAGVTRVEEDIKNSRFISTITHADTVDGARAFIDGVRKGFGDANHNCWAYVVGPPGSTRHVGAGDDGEPSGTAGRPMLAVLLGSGVGDVVVVVTRYFGGVKLGKGGLVRAYSGGVSRCLREMTRDRYVELASIKVTVPYAFVDPLRRLAPDHSAEIIAEVFAADATFNFRLPASRADGFCEAVTDLSNGAARFDR